MFLETIMLVGAVWAVASIFDSLSQSSAGLPRVGTSPGPFSLYMWWARWKWYKRGHEDVIEAYKQSKHTNYVIQTLMGDTVVLAPKFLNELNMLPESKLSSTAALVDSVMGQYCGVDLLLRDHLTSDICRGPLTRNLPIFLPQMAEELHAVMNEQLSQREPEISCVAYDFLFSFIHRISSLVFVGKSYCHSSIWTSAVTNLPIDVEITKFLLLPFPAFLRCYIAPLIPQRNRIFRQRAAVRDLLFPQSEPIEAKQEPSVMKLFIESGKDKDADSITARLLLLTAAALHTSSMAITHAIFDLCTMPEYIELLRCEAQIALAQDNGQWHLSTIKKLRRLDSFLKESQRMNQSTFLGFDRKVMSPIELSDGKTVLQHGASIVIPGGPMSRDPSFYVNPQHFDGLRFYRQYEDANVRSKTSMQQDYTGIEPGNLSWGNGRFTCPGRWYGAAMIKLIIANLLLNYDISFPPGQTERPPNTKYDTEVHPNFEQKIVLRKRRDE
ncbi:cytochrome P450 [Annulohypoxylon truncatum]|uniref:cytochrome P450 n=1 Tax=Annulohypoxylon truncatum TaxID=327061 RepID=UPI0020077903|nr:cytochrome P450 [Annulohypoxylon truncatum]KAI1211425.1 cytochrome P450 [Annulohypoxylon truncatum]